MLVSADTGRPRYWASVWQTLHGADLAAGTLDARLMRIERLYVSAQEQFGEDCLDRLIAKRDFNHLETALESYFVSLRNQAQVAADDRTESWMAAIDFVRDITDRLVRGAGGHELAEAEAHLRYLDQLHKQLRPSAPKRKRPLVRALPAVVVEELYTLTDPESPENPFRTEQARWRNHALFLLYLHQGLRRGEALILPANSIHDGIDGRIGEIVHWMNIEPCADVDPRYERPSLKTELSQRQIPVAEEIATIVDHFVDNHRGKQDSAHLFMSNQGKPLAVRTVNAIFEVLSNALSDAAKAALRAGMHSETISPHDFRHTCAVFRLSEFIESGMEMNLALQELRAFFGWSKSSDMPQHYARAYFEDRLKKVWQRKFDDRVGVLRQLRQLEREGGVFPEPDAGIHAR